MEINKVKLLVKLNEMYQPTDTITVYFWINNDFTFESHSFHLFINELTNLVINARSE